MREKLLYVKMTLNSLTALEKKKSLKEVTIESALTQKSSPRELCSPEHQENGFTMRISRQEIFFL